MVSFRFHLTSTFYHTKGKSILSLYIVGVGGGDWEIGHQMYVFKKNLKHMVLEWGGAKMGKLAINVPLACVSSCEETFMLSL